MNSEARAKLIKPNMSFGDAKKLWESPDLLDLDEGQILSLLIERMDSKYLIERGANDVIRKLRAKHRREAKLTTEMQAEISRIRAEGEIARAEAMGTMFRTVANTIEAAKQLGKQEAWAEMDKWRIKQKPLRLVSFDELQEERDKDQSSANGMLANVRFYEGLLQNMRPGQMVSDAMSEADVISLRDEVFADPRSVLRNAA